MIIGSIEKIKIPVILFIVFIVFFILNILHFYQNTKFSFTKSTFLYI